MDSIRFFYRLFSKYYFLFFGLIGKLISLNASIFNGFYQLLVYKLFNKLGLDFKLSFFYAICFAILAYPSSGTPFVDHHSTLLSLVAIIFLILAYEKNKILYWSLIPIFLFFAFLSKQVPAIYILFTVIVLIVYHFSHQKKNDIIKKF